MRTVLTLVIATLSLFACKSKNTVENAENLPKDITLKPENNLTQQADQQQLSSLIKEIDSMAQRETCDGSANFAFAAIGAKPCGGPSSYIAYPKKIESEILPQIQKFTAMQSAFNKKYNLMSDCAIVPEPTEIKCEGGKAVLVNGNSSVAQAQ
ncbi:hypothetical protein [Kaistella jeonii]|uniref:Uncharacterized protein n=1 Tax=Kaistella jeonii TaxID=266749 RepID=A0A0C1F5T8_9FLAO|nr:hypothetical protein [Kaistella jeonii]KIA88567.1 hypothetical protein OA86_11150 [Kaistella jeonii]SFC21215.1 hypothetical protein SAMN05421876_10984 [Kaistella jeonii]VEI96955.1 Uncharacterised protein [Kaistella jeonii]